MNFLSLPLSQLTAFVASLPDVNRKILIALIELLYLIVCDNATTRMDVKNLAIVLTPNFTRRDQPGVVLPIEPFWQILINNKDSVLYGGNPPRAQPMTPSRRDSSNSASLIAKPSLATPSSQQSQQAKPKPAQVQVQIPTSPPATSSQSPPSEPAQSPSVSYQRTAPQAQQAQATAVPSKPAASPPADDLEPGADSLLDGGEEDLDSLFPNEDTSLLLDDTIQSAAQARKRPQPSAPIPTTTITTPAPQPTVKPAQPTPRLNAQTPSTAPKPNVPVALRLLSSRGGDSDDDGGGDSPVAPRGGGRSLGGMRPGVKKPSEYDDDDMNLFDDSGDGEDFFVDQSLKNAEAIRKARAARATAAATTANQPTTQTQAQPATSSSPSPAPSTTSSTQSTLPRSPPAPVPSRRTISLGAGATTTPPPAEALKDSFGFEDSADENTFSLLSIQKEVERGGRLGSDESMDQADEDAQNQPAGFGFDSPDPPKRTIAATSKPTAATTAAPAANKPASAPAAAPVTTMAAPRAQSRQGSILDSSFDDDDFTLGSTLPPAKAKAAGHTNPLPAGARSPPDDLGVSKIEPDARDDDGDGSLLSLASDLHTHANAAKAKSAGQPAGMYHPDASLTFGDDTDFDLTGGDDISLKETVFGGPTPTAAQTSAKQKVPSRPSTPPRSKMSTMPPLSSVKEKVAASEDELSLSMDDSFSEAPPRKPLLGRNAAIAAAAARMRAAKAGANATTAPPAASTTNKQTHEKDLDESNYSLDLDSQLHSPPSQKQAPFANAAASLPKTPAPVPTAAAKSVDTKAAAAAAPPAKGVGVTAPPPGGKLKPTPAPDPEDNSLDLFTAADDESLLLSTWDESELPAPAAKPNAATAKKATPAVAVPAATAKPQSPKKPDLAPTHNKAAAAVAAAVAAQPKPAAAPEKEPKKVTAAVQSITKPATSASATVAAPVAPSPSVPVRDDSAELARLLREVRRLEVENLSLTSQLSASADSLRAMTDRAEDAEKRASNLAAAAGDDVRAAFEKAEAHAAASNTKLAQRYAAQIQSLTRRAEDAEAQSLKHLSAKDVAAQRAQDSADLLADARLRAEQSESALKTALTEKSYLQGELAKKDALLTTKRTELNALQLKFDHSTHDLHLAATASQDITSKLSLDLEGTLEKLRRVTSEREELFLEKTLQMKKVDSLEKELAELRASVAGGTAGSFASANTHAALLSVRMEREREQKLYEHDRSVWLSQKQSYDEKQLDSDQRFRHLLQTHTDLEASTDTLKQQLERIELQNLAKQQKIAYLNKAIEAIETDQTRRLRAVAVALAVKAVTLESFEERVASLETTIERYAPSDVFESLLTARDDSRRALATDIDSIQRESTSTSEGGGSNVLASLLEKFPSLRNVAQIVQHTTLFPNATHASIQSPATATASVPSHGGAPTTARYNPGTYRSSLEFIPLTTSTNHHGSFTHRTIRNNSEDEKSALMMNDASVPAGATANPTLPGYKPFHAFTSSYTPYAQYTSLHSAPSPPTAQTARSFSTALTHSTESVRNTAIQRATFDENRRQLMQIEAKAMAGLDASHQRLHAIEQSLLVAQAQAEKQIGQLTNKY